MYYEETENGIIAVSTKREKRKEKPGNYGPISKRFLRNVILLCWWIGVVFAIACPVLMTLFFGILLGDFWSGLVAGLLYGLVIFVSTVVGIFFFVASYLHLENQEKIIKSLNDMQTAVCDGETNN